MQLGGPSIFRYILAMDRHSIIGKYLLIGITFLDDAGEVIEYFQIYGPIVVVDNSKGIVIEKTDGSRHFSIPPDMENRHPARKGQYRLRSTGEIVDDPDFISTWTVEKARPKMIDEYKSSGFTNFRQPN